MPSVAEVNISPMAGKKRRRDEVSSQVELQMKISSPHNPRRPYETVSPPYDLGLRDELYHRHIVSPRRRLHDSKRQRVGHLDRDVYFSSEARADMSTEKGAPKGGGNIDLSPCHVCRRKPTERSELDAFGDCESCGKRTCYICTRKCEGPGVMWRASLRSNQTVTEDSMVLEDTCHDGRIGMDVGRKAEDESGLEHAREGGKPEHKNQICSTCCVERGSDGEVWCSGCLRAEEAG